MCIYCGASGPDALQYFRDTREYRCNKCLKTFNKQTLKQLTDTNHRFTAFDKRDPPATLEQIQKEVFNASSI